jgi:hypothetical protein
MSVSEADEPPMAVAPLVAPQLLDALCDMAAEVVEAKAATKAAAGQQP